MFNFQVSGITDFPYIFQGSGFKNSTVFSVGFKICTKNIFESSRNKKLFLFSFHFYFHRFLSFIPSFNQFRCLVQKIVFCKRNVTNLSHTFLVWFAGFRYCWSKFFRVFLHLMNLKKIPRTAIRQERVTCRVTRRLSVFVSLTACLPCRVVKEIDARPGDTSDRFAIYKKHESRWETISARKKWNEIRCIRKYLNKKCFFAFFAIPIL